MEGAISSPPPPPSRRHHSEGSTSQDLGRPRHASSSKYRLFPNLVASHSPPESPVGVTPYAAPSHHHPPHHHQQTWKVGQSVAVGPRPSGSSRRRSSSSSRGTSSRRKKPTSTSISTSASLADAGGNKKDRRQRTDSPEASIHNNADTLPLRLNDAPGENVHSRFNSAPGDPLSPSANSTTHHRATTGFQHHVLSDSQSPFASQAEKHQLPEPRARTKPRPNLRIAIRSKRSFERAPSPPPKSTPQVGESESQSRSASPDGQVYTPATFANSKTSMETTSTPVKAAVARQQSFISVAAGLKIRELTVPPGAARERRPPSPRHDSTISRKPLPVVQHTTQPLEGHSGPSAFRPRTSDGGKHAPLEIPSVLPQHRFAASSTDLRSKARASQAPRSPLRSLFSQGFRSKAEAKQAPLPALPPISPLLDPRPKTSSADTTSTVPRPPSAASTYETRSASVSRLPDESSLPEPVSQPSAALAAARANVAALRSSHSSTGSRSLSERSRSSSDLGSRFRAPSDPPPRSLSCPGQPDPVVVLQELSVECEGLHARYANLKAERQKLSTNIIANLKIQKPGEEYASQLLNDQLSLAAISSSMDICFAKLKLLECQKEEAIAALVAKVSPPHMSPTTNIAAMIASMAISRKPSMPLSSYSTSDVGDTYSLNRLTQPSIRTFSYGSEPDSLEYRLSSRSRKHSLSGDGVHRSDSVDRQAPETIPEVVESPRSQVHARHPSSRMYGNVVKQLPELTPESYRTGDLDAPTCETKPERAGDLEQAFDPKSRTSADSDVNSESSNDWSRHARDHDSKAQKILGLVDGSLRIKQSFTTKLADVPRQDGTTNSPLLSSRSKDNDAASFDSDKPASSDMQEDLDLQLKSFPKPNAPLVPTPGRRDTNGSRLTYGSSAASISEPEPAPPPPPSSRKLPSVSKQSHALQVYLDHDDTNEYHHTVRR